MNQFSNPRTTIVKTSWRPAASSIACAAGWITPTVKCSKWKITKGCSSYFMSTLHEQRISWTLSWTPKWLGRQKAKTTSNIFRDGFAAQGLLCPILRYGVTLSTLATCNRNDSKAIQRPRSSFRWHLQRLFVTLLLLTKDLENMCSASHFLPG